MGTTVDLISRQPLPIKESMTTNAETLNRLLELTRTLAGVSSLDAALQTATDAALDLLPCDHASLRIFDSSRTMLLCGARSGSGANDRPMAFREGEGIIGWVARHNLPALVHDVMKDDRFKQGKGQGFEVTSILAVPLLCGGQVMGVLGVTSQKPQVFSAEHETLAMLLANCAAPTIDKERLERLALVDAETRAFAQNYLLVRLHEEVGRARRHELPLSLMRIKAEHLAPHGREICFLADTIRFALRRTDVLIRTGDREFAAILPHTGEQPSATVSDRIIGTLKVTAFSDSTRLWPAVVSFTTWDGSEEAEPFAQRSTEELRSLMQSQDA